MDTTAPDDVGTRLSIMTWLPVTEEPQAYETMAEARAALRKLEGGKWKWAKPPGDGRTQARFLCNGHVDCKRLLRVYWNEDTYIIQGTGQHAAQNNLKKRSNSTLTYDEETRVRESMDQGGRSAGLRVALTSTKSRELKEAGLCPEDHKDADGGLSGSLQSC